LNIEVLEMTSKATERLCLERAFTEYLANGGKVGRLKTGCADGLPKRQYLRSKRQKYKRGVMK
jgi:hypothetical protein